MKGPTLAALEDARLKPEQVDKVLLVGGATRMPAVQRLIAEIMGKEPTRGTNPDEVVAAGAAIQANIVSGGSRDIILLDVTPLSLGIETLGGVFTRVIERNTTIPASNTMTFTTAEDGQQVVEIKVYQGEREMAADNKRLGSFLLSGIPPAPRNVPQIDVTFDIDVNGIVNVSARDQATGAERKIVITAAGGITREEVERMKNEAAGFAEEDRRKREAAETRNKAQGLLWAAEKTVKEQADAAPADLTEAICKAIEELRTALNEGDDEKIGIRHEILMNIMYKLTSSLYEKSGTEPPEFPRDAAGFRDSRFAEVSTNEGRQL
jgi:molecular chaperone DnaK